MANDSLKRALKVVLAVSLVCSLLVSSAAVLLSALQKENQRQYKIRNILIAAGLFEQGADNEAVYKQHMEPVLIELNTGERANETAISPDFTFEDFDIESFANDPMLGVAIAAAHDIAKINRRPKYMLVYIAKSAGTVDKLILPLYGKGLWSTIYGLLALERDLQTIAGITFYQHGETPGLGGEIDNPRWQRQWRGKRVFDAQHGLIIKVLRGEVDISAADAKHQIDGLAGATLTSKGINNMLHYWLGEQGYGPLLKKLRREWTVPPTT